MGSVWKGKNGYWYVQFGRKQKFLLHRLIASAAPGEVVHHRDGDKDNNNPDNLEVLRGQGEHIRLHNPVLFRWAKWRAAKP